MMKGGQLKSAQVAKVLGGLASETRVEVFRALVAHAESGLTVGEIQSTLGIPASTLSFHLRELIDAGLINQQKIGRAVICRPEIDKFRLILEGLNAECCSAEKRSAA